MFPVKTDLNVSQLNLDPLNPRLPKSVGGEDAEESELIEFIAKEAAIDDLMESIASNDYFSSEPMIVFPADPAADLEDENTQFFVAEGNRRLTALKLLHDPTLYPRRKRIATIAEEAEFVPESIPVIIYQHRADTLVFLGFRHITGIKQWEPLAKARYQHQLLEKLPAEMGLEQKLKRVAKMIGSRPHYVKRSLNTLAVYENIEINDFYGIDDLNERSLDFSVLLTAVSYGNISDYITGEDDADVYEEPDKIDTDRLESLSKWMFDKDDKGKTKIGDSRNLQYLNQVVGDKKALEEFTSGASLENAYKQTSEYKQDFIDVLEEAEELLATANGMVAVVEDKSSYVKIAINIRKQASTLLKLLTDED